MMTTLPRPSKLIVIFAAFLAAAILPAEPAAAPAAPVADARTWEAPGAVGLGPLAPGSGTPTSGFRLIHVPAAPATLGEGQWEVAWHSDWANYFGSDGESYLLDYETVRVRLAGAYGLSARTQIGFSASASYQGGGALDAFIQNFEKAVGAVNHERLAAPRDRYLIRVRYPDGTVREVSGGDAGWSGEHATCTLRHTIHQGSSSAPALAGSVSVKLPVHSSRTGRPEGSVDIGADLSVAQRLGRFNLYGGASLVYFGESDAPAMTMHPTQGSLLLAGEYRATPRTSVIAQVIISSPFAQGLGDFSERTREVAIGFKHLIAPDFVLEASVEENLLVFGNSADVAFHAGITWRSTPGTP